MDMVLVNFATVSHKFLSKFLGRLSEILFTTLMDHYSSLYLIPNGCNHKFS
jgi:hypothetical protein